MMAYCAGIPLTWIGILMIAMGLGGCESLQPEPEVKTVVAIKEGVGKEIKPPIPSRCRSSGFPRWQEFSRVSSEGTPLDVFVQDVQRAKENHYKGLWRAQACECLLVHQQGTDAEKANQPRYCKRVIEVARGS